MNKPENLRAVSATVEAPITLLSVGRSGTSLVMRILGAHRDVVAVGETAQLIFGTWNAMERVEGIVAPDPTLAPGAPHAKRCAKVVRAAVSAAFPQIGAGRWMQKPINLPWVMAHLPEGWDAAARGRWYWTALTESFPKASTLTVLRHPYDVALSAEAYWGKSHGWSFRAIAAMAALLCHPDSTVRYAVRYDRLVTRPEAEVPALLAHLDLPPDPRCLEATQQVYVPGRVGGRDADFSRRAEWDRIDRSAMSADQRQAIRALWVRFGEDLEL